jgi:MEMO1 family protein
MKRIFHLLIGSLCLIASLASANTRPAKVAGLFYSNQPSTLRLTVNTLLRQASPPAFKQPVLAAIVPHAGYRYSGQIAAQVYALVKKQAVDTVIILAPYHRARLNGIALDTHQYWQTPLGNLRVNQTFNQLLKQQLPASDIVNAPAQEKEHAIEVQLPFLQTIYQHPPSIVPIMINQAQYSSALAQALASSLKTYEKNHNVLIFASTDLSHYLPANSAEKKDKQTIQFIQRMNGKTLASALAQKANLMCGDIAVLTLIKTLQQLAPTSELHILQYRHSGQVTGDNSRVVGYLSAVILAPQKTFIVKDKQDLVSLAKKTLYEKLCRHQSINAITDIASLRQKQGAFITLKTKNDQLRGCIGSILPTEPVLDAVQSSAINSALHDPRFKPISCQELPQLKLSVSLLSLPKLTHNVMQNLQLGRNGVIVKKGARTGVFLPEVATDTGWSKTKFLNELCTQKAKLPPRCWQDPGVKFYLFSTDILK